MSLVVWLPLTKDLRQQGLSNIKVENHNATLNTAGKLGSCYYFNGSQQWLQFDTVLGDYYNNDWSIACWLKPTDSTRSVIISEYSSTGASNVGLELTTSRVVRLYWNGSPDINFTTAGALPINEWTHLTVTKQARVVKVYFNGELKQTYTNSSDFSTRTSASYPRIGDDYRGNSANTVSYQGYLNDFRMYDHCLSPMEVKKLSQGLILHYPLNRQGWGQENLVKGSNTNATSTNLWLGHSAVGGNTSTIEQDETGTYCVKVTRDATAQSSWDYLSYDNFLRGEIKTDTTYTVSFDCKPSVSGSISFTGFLNGNATNYMTNSTTTIQGNCTANQWNHMVYQCKTISSFSGITVSGQVVYFSRSASLRGTNVTVLFKNIKVEEGSIETPWCPNSADTLATTMGLNSTTEYDCSGFCNNGTKVGILGWSSNTPKYNVSLNVTTDSCARYIYGPAQTQLTNQITLACWLYQTSATATSGGNSTPYQFALSQGRDYLNLGFNIVVSNGKPAAYAGNGGSESGARTQLVGTNVITNSWHHVVATYDNGALKLYVDGQLDKQTTVGTLDYVDAPALVVGKMAYGYTNTNSYFPFIGYISDARVYATALSASDVKSLYQNCATIDPDGTIRGQIRN